MDHEVVWSPEAAEDLVSIAEYIGRDSEFYASAVVTKVLETAQSVGKFPFVGRIVPEREDETIRERFVYSYRLIYRVTNQQILITAIIHGKRLLESVAARLDTPEKS
jgi:toxin ParE1/3/4